jgi:hypothetical protein
VLRKEHLNVLLAGFDFGQDLPRPLVDDWASGGVLVAGKDKAASQLGSHHDSTSAAEQVNDKVPRLGVG